MANSTVIGKIHMDCPICHMLHEVEERTRMASTLMKGEKIFYEEHFYICTNGGSNNQDYASQNNMSPRNENDKSSHPENCEFQTESLMNNNQMAARNAYRKGHNLLTSDEIVAVRENYGLTQVETARLLGWGEATIARYESKAIQDEAYDTMLRIIKENPLRAIVFLDRNGDKFPELKRMQIRTKMVERLDSYGKEFLTRQVFASEYVKFSVPSDFNGYKLLDIDKIECIVSYYAERMTDLYKIQLMNLLWYADALCFKTYSNSMTGLVYRHESVGALPVGHNSLTNLKNMNVREEYEYESTKYHFYPNTALDTSELTKNEMNILDTIITKFRNYDIPLLVSYMQEETAYKQTNQGDIIPYNLAGKIKAL
ncbi:MAG: DUF4065 domain-containing protein [Lachnospiraceae bacterium]|nr:DUF4065 domain-containing protein [Lachnospiraceae bacterium]MDE7200547.1 DUF4065 domain-containing protein [Lachnospiraceae bacterium]